MSMTKNLEKASGMLFFCGFLLSKLQYIPFPIISSLFKFLSFGLYLLAYGSWSIANLLRPEQKVNKEEWYGFAQIKEQFLVSSLIGLTATLLSIAAVFIPILFPVAAWLFVMGNILWTVGEYHKLKNPPQSDTPFLPGKQQAYLNYAIITSVGTLITAIAATVIVCFAPIALPVSIFSALLCTGLGIYALEFWLDSNYGTHQPKYEPESYIEMTKLLGSSASPESEASPEPEVSSAPNTSYLPLVHRSNSSDLNNYDTEEDSSFTEEFSL